MEYCQSSSLKHKLFSASLACIMNMRKYYHLLSLRRSKGLLVSNRTINHHRGHLQQQPPPSPFSYSRILKNTFSRNAIVSYTNLTHSHYHLQLSKLHTSELPLYEDESSFDYQVTVKSRDVITPAVTPGSKHWLPLSNLDLLLPPIEAGLFFCYKKKDNTDMSPETVMKTIKTSLAGVLSTFYPLAGEIVSNSQGEPEVFCNNRGVEFVHAHADVDLRDLDFYHPDNSVMGKLVPRINHGVLVVQATELNCGSIILSCSFKHQVADAYSIDMFLVAWGKYAQLQPISHIPSFRPSMLNPRHPPHYESSLDDLYVPISSLPPPSSFEDPLYSRMYYVHAESIDYLQSQASTKETKISKLLSFTSFLWKLLAHGDDEAENATSRMGIVVNGRRRFLKGSADKESSLENHFGNVLSVPYGVAVNSDLKEMPLHEVADSVHKFVAATTNEEHFRGLIDWVELHRPTPTVARIYFGLKKSEGDAVVVSGGQGLPITDMDFGWGKPVFGSYHFPWGSRTGYVTTMPSATKKGDWVVYMHLKQKDLDVIERLAPNVFTPLSISTFL